VRTPEVGAVLVPGNEVSRNSVWWKILENSDISFQAIVLYNARSKQRNMAVARNLYLASHFMLIINEPYNYECERKHTYKFSVKHFVCVEHYKQLWNLEVISGSGSVYLWT